MSEPEIMKIKYVMTDKGPILFPESMVHREFRNFHPTSAGFVDVGLAPSGIVQTYGRVRTYGKSESLKLSPEVEDAKLILKMLEGEE